MGAIDEAEAARTQSMVHGQLCYLQIPALDEQTSAAFYEKIFGWRIERPHPSFESPGLIGQWTTDRPPVREGGPLLWINVNRIDDVWSWCAQAVAKSSRSLRPTARAGSRLSAIPRATSSGLFSTGRALERIALVPPVSSTVRFLTGERLLSPGNVNRPQFHVRAQKPRPCDDGALHIDQ